MSGLSRDDENWRKVLLKRQNGQRDTPGEILVPLTEAEELWLSVLNDRYEKFLDEGLKFMKSQLPSSKGGPTLAQNAASTIGNSVSALFSRIGKIGKFASLDSNNNKPAPSTTSPSASPLSASTGGVTNDSFDYDVEDELSSPSGGAIDSCVSATAKHWTWMMKDRLIIGACPLADANVSDPSGHLRGLRAQCKEKGVKISLVVSCFDVLPELTREGDRLEGFAKPRDWESFLGVNSFAELALPEDDMTAVSIPPSDTLAVCRMINDVMTSRNDRAVYLCCKGGKFRVWCIAMCFLMTQRNMGFDQAQDLLRRTRPWMSGGAMHAVYVQQVADYAAANPAPSNKRTSPPMAIQTPSSSPLLQSSSSPPNSLRNLGAPLSLDPAATTTSPSSPSLPTSSATAASGGETSSASKKDQELETKYKIILADLLQLPAEYRIRLVEDLARLT